MASGRRDDLPPMLPSMWRLCKLGYRFEPGLMLLALALALLMAPPDALLALSNGSRRSERRRSTGGRGICS